MARERTLCDDLVDILAVQLLDQQLDLVALRLDADCSVQEGPISTWYAV